MKEMRALHCVYDEKFIDGAITLFESDKRVINDYVLFCSRRDVDKPFRFIKTSIVKKKSITNFIETANQYDIVYLHSLYSVDASMLVRLEEHVKVVWLSWGWDLYNKFVVPIDLYGNTTLAFLNKEKRKLQLSRLKELLIDFRRFYNFRYFKRVMNRIDFYSGVFPYEYDLLKKYWPEMKAAPVDFYYGSTDFFIPEEASHEINNTFENVIIGNSNSPENNHLDVLNILSNRPISVKGSVILPMSYGTNMNYKRTVVRKAQEIFGNKLFVLDKYLPLEEYTRIVSNCRVAIFFHERQQASDNVLMQLLYGAKVYMSESSLMYKYLKSMGYHIFSLQQDIMDINTSLTKDEIIHNRLLLSSKYSSSKLVERIHNMVSKLVIKEVLVL